MDTERWENATVASLLYKQSHDRWAGVTPRFLKGTHAIRQSAIVRVVTLCHLHVNPLSVKCSKWSFHWFIKGPVYFMSASLIPGLFTEQPGIMIHCRPAIQDNLAVSGSRSAVWTPGCLPSLTWEEKHQRGLVDLCSKVEASQLLEKEIF